MKKCVNAVLKTMKWIFIVFCVYLLSLLFREERLPEALSESIIGMLAPDGVVVHCSSIGFGFRSGLSLRDIRVYDRGNTNSISPVLEIESVSVDHLSRTVELIGLKYERLPDSYYAPGNQEKNARVECTLPKLPHFNLILIRPNILAVCPERLTADVDVRRSRVDFSRMHLTWPAPETETSIDGFCYVDLDRQEIYGEINGLARQSQIRPLLVALDVPVSLPYMDGFTEVVKPVKSFCGWKVNLVNNDFDLWLELHPILGKYNTVPMKHADGRIHLHSYTRGDCLNYQTTVGPITGVDVKDRPLDGTVVITGTNRYNVVDIDTKSAMPVADLLKIGGFTGRYVGDEVVGDAKAKLQFRFPRAMTNNYEVLNGQGRIEIKDGHLLQLKLFAGLTKLLADYVPGVDFLVEQSQASADYTIENGVVKSDNIYIEGGVFSIKMYGQFDAPKDDLDFTVRVQFLKKDSLLGKYFLHPVTWPFTKLLLEFKMTGSPSDPHWSYVSVLDRVLEVVK